MSGGASTKHSSGANASQDGLSNIRMIVRRTFEWGSVGVAAIILVVAIKFFIPWGSFFAGIPLQQNIPYTTTAGPGLTTLDTQCDYAHRRLELGDQVVVFNPGAQCIFHFTVAGGPIEFDGPQGQVVMQPNEVRDLSQMWFETARAVDGHAILLYQLVP